MSDIEKLNQEFGKLKNVATSAHAVITQLCREQYGDQRKRWPEKAKNVLDSLDIWGCHP